MGIRAYIIRLDDEVNNSDGLELENEIRWNADKTKFIAEFYGEPPAGMPVLTHSDVTALLSTDPWLDDEDE